MKLPLRDRLPQNNFDFIRFAFASLVVFSHSVPLGTGSEAAEPFAIASRGQLTFGALAVDCFFIISGFLVLHSWQSRPEAGAFLRKRILRIYPAFLIVAIIDAFVVTPAFSTQGFAGVDASFVARFTAEAARLLAVTPGPAFQNNPAPGTVNGSLWSISYEFWCYVGVLVLGLCGLAKKRLLLAAALVVFIAVSFVFAWRHLTPGGRILGTIFGYPPIWARLIPYFVAGMAFHAFRDRISLRPVGAALALLAIAAACVLPYGMIFVLPIAAAYLIFWFAFLSIPPLQRFAKYGDFSYGIYLYSFPILQIVVFWWGAPMDPWLLFACAWPLAILVAAISWHLVEQRCIRFGKNWLTGRRPSSEGPA